MSNAPAVAGSVEPKPWQTGLAPAYIGVFLWIAFSDQLGRRALPVGGLACAMLGALAAGPLGYLLLFRVPATWGFAAGKPLDSVAEATFGERGARLVPGLLLGLGQVLLFAVAVGYAAGLIFAGLVQGGLLDPRSLRPLTIGGAALPSPLFLATSLFWALATALVSLRFTRWIAALMQYFPVFPAALLAVAMVGTMAGLRGFRPSGIDPLSGVLLSDREGAISAFLLTFQWVFAFTAMVGVAGADWGMGSSSPRDVRVGGWLGVGLAPVVVAALALIAVAGHEGTRMPVEPSGFEPPRTYGKRPPAGSTLRDGPGPASEPGGPASDAGAAPPFTLRAAMAGGFDRRLGAAMLVVFGLGSLAPACYASFGYGLRLSTLGPGISRIAWTLLATIAAWLLIVAGWSDRPGTVFDLLGAGFAPVAGAMAADFALRRGRWPGPRRGYNPAGLAAWAIGAAVGAAPTIARGLLHDGRLDAIRPASLAAFGFAFAAYGLLALLRLESAQVVSDAQAAKTA